MKRTFGKNRGEFFDVSWVRNQGEKGARTNGEEAQGQSKDVIQRKCGYAVDFRKIFLPLKAGVNQHCACKVAAMML